jgi:hypothetical protein
MNKYRVALGALIAPAIAPLLYFVGVFLLSGYVDANEHHLAKLRSELLFALLPASYVLSWLLGLPLLLTLKRCGALTARNLLAGGGIIGAVLGAMLVVAFPGTSPEPNFLKHALALAVAGCISGCSVVGAFCLVAGQLKRNPTS